MMQLIPPRGIGKVEMKRSKDVQNRVIHRLKIAQGHLKKVIDMAEKEEYCIDIVHQSQAVQKALREIDNLMMENHLKTCVRDAIENGKSQKAVREVMSVFEKRAN
jgi:DNA-binding FrmR family transcriptional regulator